MTAVLAVEDDMSMKNYTSLTANTFSFHTFSHGPTESSYRPAFFLHPTYQSPHLTFLSVDHINDDNPLPFSNSVSHTSHLKFSFYIFPYIN